MMNIIVCIKQVPATNEIKIDPLTHTIIRDNVAAIINPFDMYALEEAVRIKKRFGATVWALSMGIPAAEEILKEALSLRADKAMLMSDRRFAGADTLATAQTLSLGIQKIGGFDLIICGKQATDGDTAQVGPSLAQKLGVACVTDVSQILQINGNTLNCRKLTNDGYETLQVKLPAVITVTKEINVPGLPSLKGIRYAAQTQVLKINADDVNADINKIGLQGSPTQVVKTFVPQREVHVEMLKGNAAKQTDDLLKQLIKRNLV